MRDRLAPVDRSRPLRHRARMSLRRTASALVVIVGAGIVAVAQPRYDTAVARRLEASTLHGRALQYATDLTQTVGARLSGSAAYQRAADWSADRLREAGITHVTLDA